jgi:general secretion pathway protein A
MYAQHFGLRVEAFSLTPDPAFLYLSPAHGEALAALKVGLECRRGLLAMVGEVGTGKTTLLYSLLSELGAGIRTAYITNTRLSFDDLLRQALADFGVACQSRDRVELLSALNGFLHECATSGATAALVIDEAQNLDDDTFENLRLLSNYETYSEKLLQIVLVGQPELEMKLRKPSLRQVAERVAVRCYVNPLERRESRRYVEHRLACAGGSTALFTAPALRLALRASGGIPRRINIICHTALLFAYGRGAKQVTRTLVRAAVREREGRGLVTVGARERGRAMASASASRPDGRWVAVGTAAAVAIAVGWGSANLRLPSTPAPVLPPPADPRAPEAPRAAAPEAQRAEDVASLARDGVVSGEAALEAAAPAPAQRPTAQAADRPDARQAENRAPAYREINIPHGTSLISLAREFYGYEDPELLNRIKTANPKIVDVDRIIAGETLRLPEVQGNRGDRAGATHE